MAGPKKQADKFQPAAGSQRIQSLGRGQWVRIFTPDGKATIVRRGDCAPVIVELDADPRTPGWIRRDMESRRGAWVDVLDALTALGDPS